MDYNDFTLNTTEFEKMAKVFSYQKIETLENAEESNTEENNILSLKENLEKDIQSGIKILERIISNVYEKSRNDKLKQFITDFSPIINNLDLSFIEVLKNGIEIDFEYPQNEKDIFNVIANIIIGIITNLISLVDYIEQDENKKTLILNIDKLMQQLKILINTQ